MYATPNSKCVGTLVWSHPALMWFPSSTLMRCSHAAPVGSSSDQTERVWCYCWADGTSFLNGGNVDTVTWLLFSNDIIYSRFVLKIVRIMWLWIRMDLNPPWKLGVEDNYYTTGRPDVRWCLVLQLNKCWDIPDQQNLSVYINFQCCNVSRMEGWAYLNL